MEHNEIIDVQAPCLFFSKPCARAYSRQQHKSYSARKLCSDTLIETLAVHFPGFWAVFRTVGVIENLEKFIQQLASASIRY